MSSANRLKFLRLILWILAVPGAIYLYVYAPELFWVTLSVYCVQQLMGFNAYLHRFVAHRSYVTYKPIEFIMALLSVPCSMGSPVDWAWVHRVHHRYSDTPKDPHSYRHMGFWKTLVNLHYLETKDRRCSMKDIYSDPMMMWFHRYYFFIHAAIAGTLLIVGGLDWLIAAYILPASLHMFITLWALGILAHQWGYRNFKDRDYSTNSFLCNVVTIGDGWHNNHHRYPGRWNTRIRWWEFDLTSCYIRLIRKESKRRST